MIDGCTCIKLEEKPTHERFVGVNKRVNDLCSGEITRSEGNKNVVARSSEKLGHENDNTWFLLKEWHGK